MMRATFISPLPVHPVPGFIAVAMLVSSRVRHEIAVPRRVFSEPGEGGRLFEDLLQLVAALGADVDRAAGVMLAVTRRRAEREYLPYALAVCDLTPNDFDLPVEAAKGRDDREPDPVLACRHFHALPRTRCGGRQPVLAPELANLHDDEPLRFGAERKLSPPDD